MEKQEGTYRWNPKTPFGNRTEVVPTWNERWNQIKCIDEKQISYVVGEALVVLVVVGLVVVSVMVSSGDIVWLW